MSEAVMTTKQIEDAIMANDPIIAKQLLEVIFELEKTEAEDKAAMTELLWSSKYKHIMAPIFQQRKRAACEVVDLTGDD